MISKTILISPNSVKVSLHSLNSYEYKIRLTQLPM